MEFILEYVHKSMLIVLKWLNSNYLHICKWGEKYEGF